MPTATFLLAIAITGLVATAAGDVWQLVLKRGFGLPVAHWDRVGRWVARLPRGRIVLGDAEPVAGEAAIGWAFHYGVGLIYAAAFLAVAPDAPSARALAAVAFGAATVAAPFLILQPALGAGVFAAKAPRPAIARLVTVTTHLIFGLGLFLGSTFADAVVAA